MRRRLAWASTVLFASCVIQDASAHIAYSDMLGTNINNTQTVNPDGSTTYNVLGRVTSNGSWANAADASWGDTHWLNPWYKFTVANPQGAVIDLSVSGGVTSLPGSPATLLGDLTPGFSLYSGLLPPNAHDGATPPLPGKEGKWNALGDITMGNGIGEITDPSGNVIGYDSGTIGTITYLTHRGSIDSTDTSASLTDLYLAPGTYTLALGGTCYECWEHLERLDPNNPAYDPSYESVYEAIAQDAIRNRGFSIALNIQPVPIPAAVWMMLSGVAGLAITKRR